MTQKPHTHGDFLAIVERIAKEKQLEYLERIDYILADDRDERITTDVPEFYSRTNFGSCEGIYSDFYIRDGKDERLIFVMKTLGETDDDYIKMHILSANICLIASKYVREHEDEFNWRGYNVGYIVDEETKPYMWCGKEENARKYAEELRSKGYNATIRNNATRKMI